ncbi:MAG TPA: bifunctional riboflavin kinase/FAD synthetase [Candidatus Sulfobium mesophilum]|nr:bifunctional riboflavin kinase/FAD synthetase [Candidatus Sulfobium mesophilum]
MILITDLKNIEKKFNKSILTLGNFDGLHIGHQELVRMIISRAKEVGALSMVVTFRPHPLKILAPEKCPPLISIYEEKIRLFEKLGIDVLVKIPFTVEFSTMSPEDFVRDILCGILGASEIFVGYNYRFGKGREGDIRKLRSLGEKYGFAVREVTQVAVDGEVISSTKIRTLIKEGDVEHAAKLLGRAYAIAGIVVRGDGRGKGLGFPTANIAPKHALVPPDGVYAVRLLVREKVYDGIANIGLRPTFNKKTLAIEVNIFNFNEDIYGEDISLYFIKKLRDEKKFKGADALVTQIQSDIEIAREILASHPAENGFPL